GGGHRRRSGLSFSSVSEPAIACGPDSGCSSGAGPWHWFQIDWVLNLEPQIMQTAGSDGKGQFQELSLLQPLEQPPGRPHGMVAPVDVQNFAGHAVAGRMQEE